MQLTDDLKWKVTLHRNRFCTRIKKLLRGTVAPSGFSPLPARGRKCGEGQPAPFPAPFIFSTSGLPLLKELDTIDLQAMRDVEGRSRVPKAYPP